MYTSRYGRCRRVKCCHKPYCFYLAKVTNKSRPDKSNIKKTLL